MQFIWAEGIRKEKNVTLAFVWKSNLKYERVRMLLCAGHVFRVWKNGTLIGHGPARAAHGYVRRDEYDLGTVEENENFVIEVCAYNVRCLSEAGLNPFFGCEISSEGKTIASSVDFICYRLSDRIQKVLRYSFQRAFSESYDMHACRSALYKGDASAYEQLNIQIVSAPKILSRNVAYPTFMEIRIQKPIEYGSIVKKQGYQVWRNRVHYVSDQIDGFPLDDLFEDVSDEVCRLEFRLEKDDYDLHFIANTYGVFDFGRELSGFFKWRVTVKSDAIVYLLFDEINSAEGRSGGGIDVDFKRNTACNVVKYRLKKGNYDLMNFEPYSMRFVRLCVTAGELSVLCFGFVLYENPCAYLRKFATEDREIENIICAAQNTLAQNSVDFLMDCPSRERAGWIADAFFAGRAEYLFTDKNDALYNLLENYALSPIIHDLPKGMLPMCYPGDFPNHDYIPNFAMWFPIVLRDYTSRFRDKHLISICKDKVYGAIDYFAPFENEFGLLENLEGWIFIEWSAANYPEFVRGVNFPSNMLYSACLRCAGELYDDKALIEKSERVRREILRLSFNGKFFADNALRDETGALVRTENMSETCQYYAFFWQIADKQGYSKLFASLKNHFGSLRKEGEYSNVFPSNAFIGFLLRLDLLRLDGAYEQLLREIKEYYSVMADRTGTLWENKDPSASLNHGFASYVAVLAAEALRLDEHLFVV